MIQMKMTNSRLDSFIDKVRINVYSIVCVSVVVCLVLANHEDFAQLGIVVVVLGSACNVFNQNTRYHRLKNAIEERGFDEKLCAEFMRKPCGRNVVKTVLKRTGHFDRYPHLQKKFPLKSLI